ncbi:hypothetical protein F4775DRAFT_538314 [Biscogniauxia sp. FL1348]|nr:hypothetical protein F4775DRAFT_538314 [Biscogniauxia sp. FL1348]
MDLLTPYPSKRPRHCQQQPALESRRPLGLESMAMSSETTEGMRDSDMAPSQFAGCAIDIDDEYPLDDLEEAAMSLLGTPQSCVYEKHIPPSSVTKAWDHKSQSAEEYDSTLQYSSPRPSSNHHANLEQQPPLAAGKGALTDSEQDLLDEDVDWETIVAATSALPEPPSTLSSPAMNTSRTPMQETQGQRNVVEASCLSDRLRPFTRPPFPEKVRDRCFVPGLSSQELLRTCFRTGVMINQAITCSKQQQNVVFELFARVLYSNRETLSRKQHFQFVDLFKDQQPFPSGVLAGWKTGSPLDRHSSAFLNSSSAGPKLCWCLCRPMKDPRAAIGWTYIVLTIKETSWDQIKWSKRVIYAKKDVRYNMIETQ